MKCIDDIKFKLITEQTQFAGPVSEIIFSGKPTGKNIPAKILEKAIAWQDKYLIFSTDDVPFEEFLSISLLDKEFNIMDQARLGIIYSTGEFKDFKIISQNKASFYFIGENEWTVTLLPDFTFRVPFFRTPYEVSRLFKFKQHFIINDN